MSSSVLRCGLIERSSEAKLPTIWTDEKQRSKSEEKVRDERRREEQVRESKEKEDAGARKGRKSRNTVFFHCRVAPEGRKEGLLKRGASPLAR